MDWIKLYKEDEMGMKKGEEIESRAIKQRKEFLSKYPIDNIPNLTIEQYVLGYDNSFCEWLRHGLCDIARMGNTFPDAFDVYTKKETEKTILLSKRYQNEFGSNHVEEAFSFLKKQIVSFLEDIRKENYDNYDKYNKITRNFRDMLMIVYFYDRFVPVCTENKMNACLNSVKILKENKNKSMLYKNLALVEWKKTVPELADWTNQMALNFCDWLISQNVETSKEKLCIEKAKKIEEEIVSLNVDAASQKALVNVRVNQGIFRDLLLKRYKKCCLCGVENHTLLIASHIKPWAESEQKEKLDVDNGFLMCPNHDKLFDKYYITFHDDGKIKISTRLKENDKELLNVNSGMHIKLIGNNKKYLKFHQDVFDKMENPSL